MENVDTLIDRVFLRAEKMGLTEEMLVSLSGLEESRVQEIQTKKRCTAYEFDMLCRALAIDSSVMYRGEEDLPQYAVERFTEAFYGGTRSSRDENGD
jgi:uncharacterized protein (DUF2336 family)